MPDSYSNDGIDNMTFGDDFGHYGQVKQHSIGTEFHYDTGPNKLNLYSCNTQKATLNANDCTVSTGKTLNNTGTLAIMMRPQTEDDECSVHVRQAFPRMLLLLDPTPIDGPQGKNVNQGMGYIDLPDDQPTSGNCYDCDPQNPDQNNCGPMPVGGGLEMINVNDAINGQGGIVSQLRALKVRPDEESLLRVNSLSEAAESVENQLPRFSDMRKVQKELSLSLNGLTALLAKVEAAEKPRRSRSIPGVNPLSNGFQAAVIGEAKLARYIHRYLLAATSGKDCRSVQMQTP